MNNKLSIFLLFISCPFYLLGQNIGVNTIQGRISVESNFIDGINIKNETTRQSSTSRIEGFFRIAANEGDIITFSAVNLETLTKIITKSDLSTKDLRVEMALKSIVLKNIIINGNSEISAQKLGIPSATKHFTPAERKLQTATKGSLDGILNAFSGRTEMLKKDIIVEKKQTYLQKLEYLFEEKFYTNKLKIPKDYIKGFQYYCIEDQNFISSLKIKNKTMSEFLIIKLAENYLQIISNEDKQK
ncbi:hypothetical protein [Flavobacterium sp. TSSA_36]|uniref:hypothetical protein n=1 Tax=Flavobacterium sp. TSSA_36 TaxID=3447669 RepID=UPI003F317BC5